ncbi:MAG: hypothetical protein KDA73_15205 [Rhodobacteraceae bacterium]|nr:hypothetical protein [Paracoccaceae bacterium]
MKKLLVSAAIALPVLTAGYASAGEPMRLSDADLDGVSAGTSALAQAAAVGVGNTVLTATATLAQVQVIGNYTSQLTSINLYQSNAASAASVAAH